MQHKSASKKQKPYGRATRTTFSIIYKPVMRPLFLLLIQKTPPRLSNHRRVTWGHTAGSYSVASHSLCAWVNFLLHGLKDTQDQRPPAEGPFSTLFKGVGPDIAVGILGTRVPMTWAGQPKPWVAPKGTCVIPAYALGHFKYAPSKREE